MKVETKSDENLGNELLKHLLHDLKKYSLLEYYYLFIIASWEIFRLGMQNVSS